MEIALNYKGNFAMAVLFHLENVTVHTDSLSELANSSVLAECENSIDRLFKPDDGRHVLDKLVTALVMRVCRNHIGVKEITCFEEGKFIQVNAKDGSKHCLEFELTGLHGLEVNYNANHGDSWFLAAVFEMYYCNDDNDYLVVTYRDHGDDLITRYHYREQKGQLSYTFEHEDTIYRTMRINGAYDPESFPRLQDFWCTKVDIDIGGHGVIKQIGPQNTLRSTMTIEQDGESNNHFKLTYTRERRLKELEDVLPEVFTTTAYTCGYGDERGYSIEDFFVNASVSAPRTIKLKD